MVKGFHQARGEVLWGEEVYILLIINSLCIAAIIFEIYDEGFVS